MVKARTEVKLIRERIEVASSRNGKPCYRWTTGYYVCDSRGGRIYPPVIRREAYALARELFGSDCKVVIVE